MNTLFIDFDIHMSRLFRSRCVWIFSVWLTLSSLARVSDALFLRFFLRFGAVPWTVPSLNRIRPGTQLQIKGRKNQHIHPAA
jgi:hypothetical protein